MALLHEFHMVMGSGMKNELSGLDLFQKKGNLSHVVTDILNYLVPVIKKEHKWGKQRESRYLSVSENPDEVREHIHAYIPADIYRHLKLLHQDLNFYSIAQLVRGLLGFFLRLVDVYGEGVFDELRRLYDEWEKDDKDLRLTDRKILRQLRRIMKHLPPGSRHLNLYDSHFAPFWILRL